MVHFFHYRRDSIRFFFNFFVIRTISIRLNYGIEQSFFPSGTESSCLPPILHLRVECVALQGTNAAALAAALVSNAATANAAANAGNNGIRRLMRRATQAVSSGRSDARRKSDGPHNPAGVYCGEEPPSEHREEGRKRISLFKVNCYYSVHSHTWSFCEVFRWNRSSGKLNSKRTL